MGVNSFLHEWWLLGLTIINNSYSSFSLIVIVFSHIKIVLLAHRTDSRVSKRCKHSSLSEASLLFALLLFFQRASALFLLLFVLFVLLILLVLLTVTTGRSRALWIIRGVPSFPVARVPPTIAIWWTGPSAAGALSVSIWFSSMSMAGFGPWTGGLRRVVTVVVSAPFAWRARARGASRWLSVIAIFSWGVGVFRGRV